MTIKKNAIILLVAVSVYVFIANCFVVSEVNAAETEDLEHDPRFFEHTLRYGIDVSEWQYDIDWPVVAESGVEFVFVRVGFRYSESGKLDEDSLAKENIQGALDAGLKVGVYVFSQAITEEEAIEEAEFALDFLENMDVGPEKLALPIIIDVEFRERRVKDEKGNEKNEFVGRLYDAYKEGKLDTKTRTDITLAFLERVKSAGFDAGIYASGWVFTSWHDMSRIEENYKVWIAAWLDECQYEGRYDYWQYSATGAVYGIEGNVDLDVWYDPPVIYSESDGFWKRISGKWYYYTPEEEMKTGWLLIGEKRYYMGNDGAMRRGWKKIDGKWYYFGKEDDPDSGAIRKGWLNVDDRWYYMGDNGVMQHGWKKIDDEWYYLGWEDEPESGAVRTGWIKIADRWYYMNDNGAMQQGRTEIGERTYYFGWDNEPDSGAMRNGWVKENDYWFYYGKPGDPDSGAMQRGWIQENEVWYYLYPTGIMASNEFVNGWWLNPNGSWTYPHRASWRYERGNWWYGDDSGWYAANATYMINDEYYSFDAAGWMK